MSWRVALSVFVSLTVVAFGASVFAQGTTTTTAGSSSSSATMTTTDGGALLIEQSPPPDTTPPYVTDFAFRLTPNNRLQAGVAFSEGVEPSTVSPSSVYVVDALGVKVSTEAVAVDNGASAMLPGPGLAGMHYRLVVRHNVKDLYGNTMSADYYSPVFQSPAGLATTIQSTTTTLDETASTVADTVPPSVKEWKIAIHESRLQAGVWFSENIDQSSVSDSTVYIVGPNGNKVSVQTKSGVSSAYASLADVGWSGVDYRLVVKRGVKDLAGNAMSTDYFSPIFRSPAGMTTTATATTSTMQTTAAAPVEPNESAPRILETDAPEPRPATTAKAPLPVETLEAIGQSVHTIQTRQERVAEKVNSFIESGVDRKLARAATFSPEARQRELERVKREALVRGGLAAEIIKEAVAQQGNGLAEPGAADPVLRSSLSDIELLIKAESGVAVDLSLGSRAVTYDITQAATAIKDEQDKLSAREGLDLYRDSDNDGVSDYDERNIYHTEPENAHTGGSILTDGERILLGLDAHSTSAEQVPVESPVTAGQETQYLFEVEDISFREKPADPVATEAATTSAVSAAPAAEPVKELAVRGRALPNSFVTLYIFSTPIVVTVKTDEKGQWSYTLDKTLEDGEHTLYVAMVDNGGRIIAKSRPIAFTQTAEAASFVPLLVPETAARSPLDAIRGYLFAAGAFAALLFFAIALVTIGVWRAGHLQPPQEPAAA